ncbi:MAG: FAD-binding protein [Alphaproteobacteria bacterium]
MAKDLECDVLVAGSGASGFAAALTAAVDGLDVIMVEKAEVFGGTTCFSAGVIWIPGSRQATEIGITDNRDDVLAYLEAEGGNRLDRDKAEAFADNAASILEWFEANSHVSYMLSPAWSDYHPGQPGASKGGRSLGPRPFDGRSLGEWFDKLRPPLQTTTILGGMMVGREDLPQFFTMTKKLSSARHVSKLLLRYAKDRLSYARGTRLSNGNALIGMLARSAFDRGVKLMLKTPVVELTTHAGRVSGAIVNAPEGRMTIHARKGLVLACGGFPANEELRARYYNHVIGGKNHRTVAPAENTGDGLKLASLMNVALVEGQAQPAAWVPISLVPQSDGTTLPFPHFIDRGKAGYIAVDKRGRRFVNEAMSYHDFVPAMVEACRNDEDVHCYLICDSTAIRAYGLGAAPPFPGRLDPHLASGYIKRASTLSELAAICNIDVKGLNETVERLNRGAALGEDPEFGKGTDPYQRFNGSIGHGPNPCVAPISRAPFYAMRLVPGDIGTFIGLRTDAHARALDTSGQPVGGLYVVGNDAASFMGGTYPGAGITLGPALVFGHLAAKHIASSTQQSDTSSSKRGVVGPY